MTVDVRTVAVSTKFRHPLGSGQLYTETNTDSDGFYSAQDFGDSFFSNVRNRTEYHLGEDWNGDIGGNSDAGFQVSTASNGRVIFAGDPGISGWAGVVIIAHRLADGHYVSTLYGHLKLTNGKIDLGNGSFLSAGQDVGFGQKIGVLANGADFGGTAHLHFEIRDGVNDVVGVGSSATSKPAGWFDPTDFLHSHASGSSAFSDALVLTSPTDFDGDGKSDILFRHENGTLWVSEVSGLAFKAGGSLSQVDPKWHVVANGDYDGDGKSDLLFQHENGDMWVTLMNGLSYKSGNALFSVDPAWHVVGAGDYDGDGKSDILFRHNDGTLWVTLMNGLGAKAGGSIGKLDPAWHVAADGDYDGDKKSDILFRHDNGDLWLTEMNGVSTKAGGALVHVDPAWHIDGSGDYDGDGKSDILFRHNDGTLWVTLVNGFNLKAGKSLGQVDNSWHIAGGGDYDGDHKSDILFRHSDGTLWITEMNGLAFKAGASLGPVENAWHVVPDQHDLFLA